jgi:uncharacterized protein (DUF1697 family)
VISVTNSPLTQKSTFFARGYCLEALIDKQHQSHISFYPAKVSLLCYSNKENEGEIPMTRFVSLFRGINVGGHHTVPMDALKDLHESLGLKDVATYIQSGNVVFTSERADVAQIQRDIEEAFAQKFGFQSKVIIRSASEFKVIIENNPFQNQPIPESKWVVAMFLASHPGSTALQDIQKTYTGPEEIHIMGQEAFIYYTEGQGRSKLTNTFLEKKLKTAGTARNWNTVLKLQKMMEG